MSLLDDKLETFVAVCETKKFYKSRRDFGLDATCRVPSYKKAGRRVECTSVFA